jgi:hypothetical protein
MASFVIIESGHPERVFNLDHEKVVIGREPAALLRLANVSVSRQHAQVTVSDDGGVDVTDLGSQNGTLINGRKLEYSHRLGTGDQVQVGKFVLVFYGDERTSLEHQYQGRSLSDIPLAYGLQTGAMKQTATFQLSPALLERLQAAAERLQGGLIVTRGTLRMQWPLGRDGVAFGTSAQVPAKGFPWWGRKAAVAWNGNRHVLRRLSRFARVEVNGNPVVEKMLGDGDKLCVGSSYFRYEIDEELRKSAEIPFDM